MLLLGQISIDVSLWLIQEWIMGVLADGVKIMIVALFTTVNTVFAAGHWRHFLLVISTAEGNLSSKVEKMTFFSFPPSTTLWIFLVAKILPSWQLYLFSDVIHDTLSKMFENKNLQGVTSIVVLFENCH